MNEFNSQDIVRMREEGLTWKEIAEHYGVWRQRVTEWAKRQPDLPQRIFGPLPRKDMVVEREELEAMMHEGLSDREMAHRLGMKESALARLRLRRGLPRTETGIDRSPKTPDQLKEVQGYLDEGYSFKAISDMLHIGERTLAKYFPGRGFTAKQSSEAALMAKRVGEL